MTYEEKQMAKLERFQELASKNAKASESAYNSARKMADFIPFGQPILVGHHSEGRHRRDLARINGGFSKSVELSEKSEYYENKVQNILNPTMISSDDENAISKLEEKKANLEKMRDDMKRINKEFKKTNDLSKIEMTDRQREYVQNTMRVWNGVYGNPYPSYELTNTGATIRNITKRIEHLKRLGKVEESEEEKNGIKVKVNTPENRVQIFFPGKPSEEIRTKLKSNGFRWSPFNGCWQRQISDYAIRLAKDFMEVKDENKMPEVRI
jgi:hypothetical protein